MHSPPITIRRTVLFMGMATSEAPLLTPLLLLTLWCRDGIGAMGRRCGPPETIHYGIPESTDAWLLLQRGRNRRGRGSGGNRIPWHASLGACHALNAVHILHLRLEACFDARIMLPHDLRFVIPPSWLCTLSTVPDSTRYRSTWKECETTGSEKA